MFLNRKKKGYGFYATVNTDKKGDKVTDNEVKYVSFYFARDCEPTQYELNEHGSYQGDLFFRDSTGAERKVFPYVDEYYNEVAFKILGKTNEYHDPDPTYMPKTEPKWDLSKEEGKETIYPSEITEDDLPFM